MGEPSYRKVSLVKVQPFLCTEDEGPGDAGGFWGIHLILKEELLLLVLEEHMEPPFCYHKPKHSLQAARPSWYPKGKKPPTQEGFNFFFLSYVFGFFLVAIYLNPEGSEWPRPLLPTATAQDWRRGLMLPVAGKGSTTSAPINLNRPIRLFALSIRK